MGEQHWSNPRCTVESPSQGSASLNLVGQRQPRHMKVNSRGATNYPVAPVGNRCSQEIRRPSKKIHQGGFERVYPVRANRTVDSECSLRVVGHAPHSEGALRRSDDDDISV